MPIARFQMPDGRVARFEVPDGTTPEQAQTLMQDYIKSAATTAKVNNEQKPKEESSSAIGRFVDSVKSFSPSSLLTAAGPHAGAVVGGGEAGLNLGTGLASQVLGGLGAMGSLAWSGVENQWNKGLHIPTQDEFDAANQKAVDLSNGVQQALTYQPRTNEGKLVAETAALPLSVASDVTRYVGGAIGGAVGGEKGRIAGEELGGILPASVATVAGGSAALSKARQIAASKQPQPAPGVDYTPLRDLSPEEMARMQRMKEQGIQPTLGQVTRNPEQFRFEDQTGKTQEGAALRTRELDTNDALIKAIQDVDKKKTGQPMAENQRQAGAALANALRENEAASRQKINDLYNLAREAGETKSLVDTTPLEKVLADNFAEHNSLDVIQRKLKRLEENNGGRLTVNDAETLYKTASEQTTYGDPSAVYMGKVKAAINEMTEGAGGDLYRQAREARLKHGLEYEDQGAIARLVEKKPGSRTDFKTPDEAIFNKTVVNGSLDDLQAVTSSLLKNGSKNSLQALRELQSETINHILDKATEKGVPNERGVNGLSAPALRNAINQIGTDKLNHLLGPDVVESLQNTVKNAQDVKQAPGRVQGSDTAINLQDKLKQGLMQSSAQHLLGWVPGIGKGISAISDYLQAQKQAKITQQRVSDALTPRRASAADIEAMLQQYKAAQRQQNINTLKRVGTAFAPAAYAASVNAQSRQRPQTAITSLLQPKPAAQMINDALRSVDESALGAELNRPTGILGQVR